LVPAGGSAEPQGSGVHQEQNDYRACSRGRENDLAYPPDAKCIVTENRERNPGNYFQNTPITLFYGLE